MKLQLIAVGTKMPAWVTLNFQNYASRFPRDMSLELIEIPAEKRAKNADIDRILNKEGEMPAQCDRNNHIIALDIPGKPWSTSDLACQMEQWKQIEQNIALLIGDPEGLALCCKDAAYQCWSLSPVTLPYPLVRVILAERLYRAYTLARNHSYHRE